MGAMMGAHHSAHAPNTLRECEDDPLERSGVHASPDTAFVTVSAPYAALEYGGPGAPRRFTARSSSLLAGQRVSRV